VPNLHKDQMTLKKGMNPINVSREKCTINLYVVCPVCVSIIVLYSTSAGIVPPAVGSSTYSSTGTIPYCTSRYQVLVPGTRPYQPIQPMQRYYLCIRMAHQPICEWVLVVDKGFCSRAQRNLPAAG
jgi:hypothetical protein